MGKLKDLTGQKFGKLIVIERAKNDKHKRAVWLCQCECGNKIKVSSNSLKRQNTRSCGCLAKNENTYIQLEDCVYLIITSFKYGKITFIIDKNDYLQVKQYHWGVAKLGNNFYAKYSIYGHKAIFLHRLITNCVDNLVVDHINRNTLDNRKSNLRICNNLVNIKNRPINKAGYRGIIQNDVGKYRVRLQINKVKFDKTFDTLERAIKYRNELEEKYHKKEEIICPI